MSTRQPTRVTGRDVLDEINDLIRRRLPYMDPDDPVREVLSRVAPDLARAVGKPPVRLVPKDER